MIHFWKLRYPKKNAPTAQEICGHGDAKPQCLLDLSEAEKLKQIESKQVIYSHKQNNVWF